MIDKAPKLFIWREGSAYCALVVEVAPGAKYDGRRTELLCIYVANNGESWVAASYTAFGWPGRFDASVAQGLADLTPDSKQPVGLQPFKSIRRSQPEYRLPVEWARRALRTSGRVATTKAAATVATEYLHRSGSDEIISYTGFARLARASKHTLADLHREIDAAVAHCDSVWGWKCSGLEVKFHDAGLALGLAYAPGSGPRSMVRKVSLAAKLVERYDLPSIRRVVIHELCHHYREEAFPRVTSSPWARPHDAKFCELLAVADPVVRDDPRSCEGFYEESDPAVVSATEAAKFATRGAPVWSPEAGVLVVTQQKTLRFFVSWRPSPAASKAWTPARRPVNDNSVLALLKAFPPEQWRSVRVECVGDGLEGHVDRSLPGDLFALAVAVGGRYANVMKRTNAYLKDASP